MPEVGDNLGRYTLLKRLAVGGMGEVFLAAKAGPVGFGPYVALKVLREELAVDRQFVEMLVDEANISMFLNHQNVVSVLDLSEDDGRYYIAMEYIQGITVERLVESLAQQGHCLPIPHALYVATELCRALKYAHTRVNHAGEPLNIVHRDVTPANILLSTQGEVKLTDFGIARARGRVHQTQAGVLKGKFGYMAPEMVRYERIDARADLFCAGVVVYLMLSGQHPVAGAAVMEAIQRFEDKQIQPPSAFNPQIPAALDTIVMRALEPKPDYRWSSAAAFGDALQDVVLQNPLWRRDAKDGAKHIAQLMRSVATEAFDEPMQRDVLAELLARSQRGDSVIDFKSEASTSASRAAQGEDESRASSATITAREQLADTAEGLQRVHSGSGSSQNLMELDTDDALPAIREDQNWGPTPVARSLRDESGAIETDEELSLARISEAKAAIDRETDTDENQPGASAKLQPATEDVLPNISMDGVADAATVSFAAADMTPRGGSGVEVQFPESSTDRNRVHDDMMAEPSLPGVSREAAARAPDKEDDGETVVGVSLDDIAPDDDDELIGEPTMAMPPVQVEAEDGKTVAGVQMPNWDEIDAGQTAGPVVIDPGLMSGDDEDVATIIPSMMNEDGPSTVESDVASLLDGSDWDQPSDELGDATLLDGVKVSDVQAALQAARGNGEAGVQLVRDESNLHDPVVVDRDVEDSLAEASVSGDPSGPHPFSGPIRIVMNDDQPALATRQDVEDVAALLAQTAGASDEAPTVGPPGPQPPTPSVSEPRSSSAQSFPPPSQGVGQATGQWMAGQLDANALEWDDDAAARRAVATRNANPSPARGVPAAANPPPVSQPMYAAPSVSGPAYAPPSAPMANMPPRSFLGRNWLVLTTVTLATLVFTGLGYLWMFTPVFWPKLKLESTPSGALVKVDQIAYGETPVEVKVAPGQRHLIEFEKDGFKVALREITEGIGRGRTYKLPVALERRNPRVRLPVDGKAFVNDREAGVGTEIELAELPTEGKVEIRVEADGYEPYRIAFDTVDQVPPSFDIPLVKKTQK